MNYFILSLLIICLLYLFLFKNKLIEANSITTIYNNNDEASADCVDENNNINSTIIQGSEYALSKLAYNNKVREYENTIREYQHHVFQKDM